MNGTRSSVVALAQDVARAMAPVSAEVVVCPAFVHLADVLGVVGNTAVKLGAQNCSEHDSGAHTGECSASMLVEFGCEYVIVGHSERRTDNQESNSQVAAKCRAVQLASMTPILCVGETLEQRREGQLRQIIHEQLDSVFSPTASQGDASIDLSNTVIAYEPVWAIGTGETASPAQAQEVHSMIRVKLSQYNEQAGKEVRILYGGSMKPSNAGDLLAEDDIDGGLIGGASLNAEDFIAICKEASRIQEG